MTIWSDGERPPSGWIAVEEQEAQHFMGWLDLLRILQESLERGSEPSPPTVSVEDLSTDDS